MEISTQIIAQHLSRQYKILLNNEEANTSLCSFRFYESTQTQARLLYVMRAGHFAYFDDFRPDCAYLIVGTVCTDSFQPYRFKGTMPDIIWLENDVDLLFLSNQLNEIFDFYNQWEQELNSCTPDINGLQKMIDCSDGRLHGAIILADYMFNYVGYSASWAGEIQKIRALNHGQTPSYIVEDLLTNPEYLAVQNVHYIFEYPIHRHDGLEKAYCYNLFRPGEEEYHVRILFVPDSYPATRAELSLLQYFGEKLTILYNQLSDYSMPFFSYHELRSAVKNGLEKEPVSKALLKTTLRFVNWNLNDHYQLLTFTPYFLENTREINAVTRSQLEVMIPGSCSVIHDNRIVLLINLSRGSSGGTSRSPFGSDTFSNFIRDHLYKVGASAEFHDFTYLHQAYRESMIALEQGNRRDSTFWFYSFTSYSLPYMVEQCQRELSIHNLCIPGLITLQNYDASHGTSYVNALYQFINCKYNVTHTAKKLYLHRTTFLKHLKKIEEISALNLDDWDTRLHLMLSMQFLLKN